MNKLVLAIAVIVALLIALVTPQLSGVIVAISGKHGRVIDVSTGKGIPDAFVIASALFRTEKLHGSHNERLYRIVVKTDSNGDYVTPSAWTSMKLGMPGLSARTTFAITAFKPTYAVDRDEQWWRERSEKRNANPPSTITPPEMHWDGITQTVDPIGLKEVQFNFLQAADYYSAITWFGYDISRRYAPIEIELRHAGNEYFRPQICQQPPEMRIEGGLAMAQFVYGNLSFVNELSNRDPDFSLDAADPIRRQPYARDLCAVMSSGWDTP